MQIVSPIHLAGILPHQSMTVLFKPLSGIIRQSKFLPIRYMPQTSKLTWVDDPTLQFLSHVTNHTPVIVNGVDRENLICKLSYTWSIQNAMVKCDLIALDSGFK